MNADSPYTVCETLRKRGVREVCLSFSAGKDSLAAWVALRHAGIKVVPLHFEIWPGLPLLERVVDFYQDFFKTKIHRVPHKAFWDIFRQLLFVGPYHVRTIEDANLHESPSLGRITENFLQSIGKPDMWVAMGIKRCDSNIRRMVLAKMGTINARARKVYPMANASDRITFAMLIKAGVPLPSFYPDLGESIDSITRPMLEWIRDHAPEDYAMMLALQPLLELEYARTRI
jgi:hypothetical protein